MTLYFGSTKIADTGKKGVYYGSTPIKAIYKGSELVYQYNPYEPGTILKNVTGENTYTVTLPRGVYYVEVVGAGAQSCWGYYYACFNNSGGSGAACRGEFYNPTSQSFTFYSPGNENTVAAYMNVGSTRVLTANPGNKCCANGSCSTNTGGTGTVSIPSSITNISLTAVSGNAGSYAANAVPAVGASVSIVGDGRGQGGTANCSNEWPTIGGGIYLKYVRYSK